jgi:hypothetical protein
MTEKKSELEILSPEIEILGRKIRPWTFEQFVALLPTLAKIGEEFKEKGITLEHLDAVGDDSRKIFDLLTAVAPSIPAVVAKTLRIEQGEVESMDYDQVITIAVVILIQNAEKLKNFSGLGRAALQSLTSP